MPSKSQINADRKNASPSTGPKTAPGKAASSRNATKHGLSSAGIAVLPTEDPADLDALVKSLTNEHQPQGDTENFLVHQMIAARWKLARVERLEHEAFDRIFEETFAAPGLDRRVANTLGQNGNILDKFQRYAAAAERSYYKALKELQNLRSRKTDRKRQNEAEDAQAVLQELLANTPESPWESNSIEDLQNEPNSPLSPIDASPLRR